MGFLRILIFHIIIILILVETSGCSSSSIETEIAAGKDAYSMFGRIPERSFYYPITIGDSLKKLWEAEINGSFPNSSISFFDKYIFINDLSGRIYCFNMENGKKIGQLKNKGAVYSTPVVERNLVIYLSALNDENNSYLYYYDMRNSLYINEIKISGRALTEIIKSDDGIIFTTEKGIVYKYNFTGDKIWETNTKAITNCSPAMNNSSIIFGNNYGELISLNKKDGNIQYRTKIGGYFTGGASISDSNVLIGNDNGNLYSINITSGKINWNINTGSRIVMTPVSDNSDVYIGNLRGDFYSINKNNGKINWDKRLGTLFNITPLATNNLIILPDQNGKIYLIEKDSGIVEKTYKTNGRQKLNPVIKNNNLLFLGYDNGILEAYEIYN
jgi:eukaryotic-like serine/threonine-protein kinase